VNLDPSAPNDAPEGPAPTDDAHPRAAELSPKPSSRLPALLSSAAARLRRHRTAATLGAFVLSGVAIAWLVLPPSPDRIDPDEKPPRVTIVGQPVTPTPEGDAAALEVVRKWAAGTFTVVVPGGDKQVVSKAALGAEIDRVRLASLLAQVRDATSAMRRALRSAHATSVALPVPVATDATAALPALYKLKDAIDRAPVDARIDLETKRMLPEQPGRWLDVWGTLARIDDALAHGRDEVEAVVATKPPRVGVAQMGDVAFADVLGWFETRYNPDKKHEARTYNLRLAASKLDGHVIMPGETFDFNDVVGPRDEANGYRVAPVIAQGELVDGIGGGTCQIAGTLHGAALFSGLEIVERHPHTRPSGYIKMGLDATVVYPTITLRLKNGFAFPVVLHETVRDGVVRAEVLGPKRTRTVTFIRKIDEVTPFQEVERPDPKLPDGVKVLSQRGIPGFKIHRYRVVRDGPFAVREKWNDVYPPTTQIIRVGTGDMPKDSVKVPDDEHPEYVADDYLVLMQGPEVRTPKATRAEPGGGMVEVRVPGPTGEHGWTERAGFSHWKGDEKGAAECGGGECGDAPVAKADPADAGVDAPASVAERGGKKKHKKRRKP
jgi:vancomycin resistance protein YoaR